VGAEIGPDGNYPPEAVHGYMRDRRGRAAAFDVPAGANAVPQGINDRRQTAGGPSPPRPADEREPWLAIDPEPLAGDPGFALLAALHNRSEQAVATGDVPRAIRRRFDLMTDIVGLDRKRTTAWTLARILQYALWDIERDYTMRHTEPDRAIARILLDSAG
jgi:hypothetical protein